MKLEIMEKYFQMESLDELHNEFKSHFFKLVEDTLTLEEVSIIKDYYEDKRYTKIRVLIEDEVYITKSQMIRAIEQSKDVDNCIKQFSKWQKLDNMFSQFMDIRYNLLSK